MTAMAGLSFVIHLWLSLQKGGTRRWQMFLLLASPYIMFLGFSVAMIVLGSMYPETVSRSRYLFYCTINLAVVNAVPGTSALIMGVVLIFEILVGIKLYRHSKAFKAMDRTGTNTPPFHLFVRMGVFSGYSLLALVACIAFWSSSGDNLPYFIQASLPTAAFLIFGTQRDILQAWRITTVVSFLSGAISRSLPSKESHTDTQVAFPTMTVVQHNTMDHIPSQSINKDAVQVIHIPLEKGIQMV